MINPNAQGLCGWCEAPGVAYICPTCNEGHCSAKCLTGHIADSHKAPPLVPSSYERVVHALLVGLGFIVRWTFFIASGLALLVYCAGADWSMFDTRFADLTIARFVETLTRVSLVGLLGWGLWKWAFKRGKKEYLAWLYCVFYGIGACLAAAYLVRLIKVLFH